MKCFGHRCPVRVEKRVSVMLGTVETWSVDTCGIHAGDATRDALSRIMEAGQGSLHTARYAPVVKRRRRDDPYRPYLVMTREDHRAVIAAQQCTEPRESLQVFMITAIRDRVRRVLSRQTGEYVMNNDQCPESMFGHAWVAGAMRVHDEDVATVAASRPVECEQCEYRYQTEGEA